MKSNIKSKIKKWIIMNTITWDGIGIVFHENKAGAIAIWAKSHIFIEIYEAYPYDEVR